MNQKYDAIVIGAGMSGLAAGIRLAMFDKKVCILEKHTISGGLNSYYKRKNKQTGGWREFDVGLHALTNFVKKGERGKPLTKLLKQLRLKYDDLKLKEQNYSLIKFPGIDLKFTNDFNTLKSEILSKFPNEADNFLKLVQHIENFNEVSLDNEYASAKEVIGNYIQDKKLIEMMIAPLLIYGSAWENDMDFSQFVIMFKSLYFEGFSRPEGGVRTIIKLLEEKFTSLGGELLFKHPVEKLLIKECKAYGVELKDGSVLEADKIFSSMGYPETMKRIEGTDIPFKPRVGNMSFMETIICFDKKVPLKSQDATIIFYNDTEEYKYRKPDELFDKSSAVFCIPDNYGLNRDRSNLLSHEDPTGEGMVRITYMANYELWKNLERKDYLAKKEEVFEESLRLTKELIPDFDGEVVFKDVFSPTTVERYTWHESGTVYGSIDKTRDGKTPFDNLFIIGTDQGFLGIVGSMLSGISMANLHGLMGDS